MSNDPSDPIRATRVRGPKPTDDASGVEETATTGGIESVVGTGGMEFTHSIAQALADGTLDVEGATQRLVDEALAAQAPGEMSPQAIEALRAEIRAALDQDPTLQRLLAT